MNRHVVMVLLLLTITGCSLFTREIYELPNQESLFIKAFEGIMSVNSGLNYDMKYISISSEDPKWVLSERDKESIRDYFYNKYDVEILFQKLDELIQNGLLDEETLVLTGVLLRVSEVHVGVFNEVRIIGDKYRAGNGGMGAEIVLRNNKGEWEIKEAKGTWVSKLEEGIDFI